MGKVKVPLQFPITLSLPPLIAVHVIGIIILHFPFTIVISFLRHAFSLPKDHEPFIFTHNPSPSSPHMPQHIILQYQPRVHIWKFQNMGVRNVGALDVDFVVIDCGKTGVLLVIVEVP